MKIQEFFDAGYYINLDSRDDRNTHITKVLHSANLDIFVQRISAEDGTHEVEDYMRQHYCSASHRKIFLDALEKGYKNIVVFEDDFNFYDTDDYKGIENIEAGLSQLKNIEDWDIVYFGGYIFDKIIKKVDTNLLNINTILALHGYGLSTQGMNKLLRHRPFVDCALDGWIGQQDDINKYIIYPLSSYQVSTRSDLDAFNHTPPLSHWVWSYITPDKIIV
jgi:GR25 family glycosyltransferase involved in LPS biosynthesis